jgi:hypothetical protein
MWCQVPAIAKGAVGLSASIVVGMSALPPKADIPGAKRNVRYVPIADIRWLELPPRSLKLWPLPIMVARLKSAGIKRSNLTLILYLNE